MPGGTEFAGRDTHPPAALSRSNKDLIRVVEHVFGVLGPLAALTLRGPPNTLWAASVIGELRTERGCPNHMSYITALISSFRREEEGQGLAEYALILALIAIVAIVALIFLGGQVSKILSTVGTSV